MTFKNDYSFSMLLAAFIIHKILSFYWSCVIAVFSNVDYEIQTSTNGYFFAAANHLLLPDLNKEKLTSSRSKDSWKIASIVCDWYMN